jgi:Zn-dependent M28 family amino/carboxypeptidase
MKKLFLAALLLISSIGFAQKVNKLIKEKNVKRIITTLSADNMMGRPAMVPAHIEPATAFIESEFKKIGLTPLKGLTGYRQEFMSGDIKMNNVVGMIEGSSRPDEIVVFSAHYDHIGIRQSFDTDSIANGADDDASGTTAVIALASYFKKMKKNNRTLIFVAFTAEEVGGFGSQHFSKQLDPNKVVAMFNIEMIGKPSKWGQNSAFITGFDLTDFGAILQKNLVGSPFQFKPDPYPEQNLFYRSDNATLAELGVPAHTISTDEIDIDKFYHTVDDEIETLNISNITSTIRAIALSAQSIVSGADTPKRIAR